MKTVTSWNFSHYTPLDRREQDRIPYITRVVPAAQSIAFDFEDPGANSKTEHTLYYRRRGEETYTVVPLDTERHGQLCRLRMKAEYEFFVKRLTDGRESDVRIARTGIVPGTVIDYLHPEDPAYGFSGHFLGAPSLCRLDSGTLLAAVLIRGHGGTQNLTRIYASENDGKSWSFRTELYPCCLGQLFTRGGRLYVLACAAESGDLLIGSSEDEGRSFSMPTILFRGASDARHAGLLRAPMPLLVSGGRLRTDLEFGTRDGERSIAVLSAPADCDDYTDPTVWTLSDFWAYSDFSENALVTAVPSPFRRKSAAPGQQADAPDTADTAEELLCIHPGDYQAVGEGTVIEAPDHTIYEILRFAEGAALLLRVPRDDPEAAPEYAGLLPIDITRSKFEIQQDSETGTYYTIANRICTDPVTDRNLLTLYRSDDLLHWNAAADLLDAKAKDPRETGFQNVAFCIDGDDLLFVSQTSYNGASTFRDSNHLTFHKISGFRSL